MYVFLIYNKKRLSEKTVFKARVAGFEPANDGIRIRCLTAWRYPIKKRETRFELAALALARRCSTTEPFAHIMQSRGLEPLPSLPGLDP